MKEKRSQRAARAFERALTKSEELLVASLGVVMAREKSARDVLSLRRDYAHTMYVHNDSGYTVSSPKLLRETEPRKTMHKGGGESTVRR
jgi:IS5 family transposase